MRGENYTLARSIYKSQLFDVIAHWLTIHNNRKKTVGPLLRITNEISIKQLHERRTSASALCFNLYKIYF